MVTVKDICNFNKTCKLHLILQEQMIAAEEKSLQEEKKRVAKELRERTTEETERLLKEQDKRIGLLIARLQVGLYNKKKMFLAPKTF